jgi:hypothetical protein
MNDDTKIEIAGSIPNECLKTAGEVYRNEYDRIFRSPKLELVTDPKTGDLAEKKPAGEN